MGAIRAYRIVILPTIRVRRIEGELGHESAGGVARWMVDGGESKKESRQAEQQQKRCRFVAPTVRWPFLLALPLAHHWITSVLH